jgi:hypothetical protein
MKKNLESITGVMTVEVIRDMTEVGVDFMFDGDVITTSQILTKLYNIKIEVIDSEDFKNFCVTTLDQTKEDNGNTHCYAYFDDKPIIIKIDDTIVIEMEIREVKYTKENMHLVAQNRLQAIVDIIDEKIAEIGVINDSFPLELQ